MLDGGQRRRRTGDEERDRAFGDFFLLNRLAKLRRDVDDIAVAGSCFGDFLGLNGDHAIDLT